ncbi:MAG: glycosyltransferase family 2 protein [Dysgonomonas sp.]
MKKSISIIVPVYNVEKYLERCILSIVTQDLSPDLYELIVVNDGSTDNSPTIIRSLKEKFPFIRIIDKENGGLSSARNAGLEIASGDYIFFIDSDDWISKNSLSFLHQMITKNAANIILFGIREVFENGKVKQLDSALAQDNSILDITEYTNKYTIRSSAWNGLFSKQLIDDCNFRFKDGFFCEDDDFVVRIFAQAENIVCTHQPVYNYFQRTDSISKNRNDKHNKKLIQDKLLMIEELTSFISTYSGPKFSGLKRKLDFLTVDVLRLLLRQNHVPEFVKESIDFLEKTGYYPLPKAGYSLKYSIFRQLTYHPFLFQFYAKIGIKGLF